MAIQPLRERALHLLKETLGEPESFRSVDGMLHRWQFSCDDGRTVRLTLSSPEFPDLVHLLVSDTGGVIPLNSAQARSEEELDLLLKRIRAFQTGGVREC